MHWLSCYTYPAAPGVVDIVDIVAISNTISTVTWRQPMQTNGIITGYEVMYSIYESTTDITNVSLASDVESYNITDLSRSFMHIS